jgi:hypothetical protein
MFRREHQTLKAHRRIAPRVSNLALGQGMWWSLHTSRFSTEEAASSTSWLEEYRSQRGPGRSAEAKNFLPLPGIEFRSLVLF